jgi:hypothetical protein
MRAFTVGLVAFSVMLCGVGAAFPQSFEVGPGGVRVYPDGGAPRVYQERRVYEERPRYYEDRGDDRRLCAQLRAACEYGERGEGNCRRYRRTCG